MKRASLIVGLIITLVLFFAVVLPSRAGANSAAGFQAGQIISDAVMVNKNAMSASQIQRFLESKVPDCDTNGQKPSEFGGPDLNGDGRVQRWEWGKNRYGETRFICLKDYVQNGKKASQLIYEAGQKYSINPQVLIVLLQKEQGLVTDTWPVNIQYRSATGYGCPDTAACDSKYYGLANQLDWAAKMYRSILNQDPNWYSPYFKGVNPRVYWHPDLSRCGSQSLNIQNWSTAGLYSYTPYRPNQAALNAGYGIGDSCSSYGNRNFYLYFTDWFGDTYYVIRGSIGEYYNANDGVSIIGAPTANENTDGHGFWWQRFENGYIAGQSTTGYFYIKGSIGEYYDRNNGPSLLGKPLEAEKKNTDSAWMQVFDKGLIAGQSTTGYYTINGPLAKYYEENDGFSTLGKPLDSEKSDNNGVRWQKFLSGYVIGSSNTGYWESSGEIRDYWGSTGYHTGQLGLPIGPESSVGGGSYQPYQNGTIIGGGDNIYYTLKGSIGATYARDIDRGYSALGFPVANEIPIGTGYTQQFQKGYISGVAGKYYPTSTPIYTYWESTGGLDGRLGAPLTENIALDNGEYQRYAGGAVIGSLQTGYQSIKGSIGATYLSNISKYVDILGLPLRNEIMNGSTWEQQFQKGYLIGRGNYYISSKSIRDYWTALDSSDEKIGLPVTDLVKDSAGASWQHFQGGVIITNPKDNTSWESRGKIRELWASTGYQAGPLGYPTGPEIFSNNTYSQTYEHGKIEIEQDGTHQVIYN